MSAVRDEQQQVRAIVQRWLDGTERSYPCHSALRDLAVLLRLERVVAAPAERTTKQRRGGA